MAKTNVGDLAIVLSADSSPLVADLRTASKRITDFQKDTNKDTNSAAARGMLADARAAARMVSDLRRVDQEVVAIRKSQASASSAFLGNLGRAGRGANDLHAAYSEAGAAGAASFMKMGGAVFAAGAVMQGLKTGAEGVAWAFGQAKDSVRMAADVERTGIAFEVMLGSAEHAAALMKDLRKYAAETPFGAQETTDAAKQLMAFGTAANDIIPTLKVLGNITAPIQDTTSLKDMVYLFGTLQTQGRAYAQDIRQFTGRGVKILEPLAAELGVAKDEVANLVEEGRVGFPQVARALEALQAKGGPFAGMMDKQAQSLHGLWEQAKDAFDLAKLSLGQMIVKEAGLHDVVRDLEAVGKSLSAGMDNEGLRQGVRLAADLTKGVAQVGYEFVKAGAASANIFGAMAAQLPAFRETFAAVGAAAREMKEFRLDPETIAHLSITGSKELLAQAGVMTGLVATLGETFATSVLDPIVETLKEIRATTRDVQTARSVGTGLWNIFKPSSQLKRIGVGIGFMEPQPGAAEPPGAGAAAAPDDPGRKAIAEMIAATKRFSTSLGRNAEALDQMEAVMRDRLQQQKRDKELELIRADLAIRRRDLANQLMLEKSRSEGGIGFLPGLGMGAGFPMASAVGSAITYRREFDKSNAFAAMGGNLMGAAITKDLPPPRLNLPDQIDPHLKDVLKQLKEKYDPLNDSGELMRAKRDLDALLARGEISPKMHELGWRDAVQGTANRLGIGPTQLPEAMSRDSEQATRTINAWRSNDGKQGTTEGLLEAIRIILSEMLGLDRRSHGPPTVIHLPRAP